MVYLPTFTINLNQLWGNTSYMDPMGYTIHPKSRYDSVRLTLDKVQVKNVDVIYERALTTSNIEELETWLGLQPGFNSFGWSMIIKTYTAVKVDGNRHSQEVAQYVLQTPTEIIHDMYIKSISCFFWECMPFNRNFSRLSPQDVLKHLGVLRSGEEPARPGFSTPNWQLDFRLRQVRLTGVLLGGGFPSSRVGLVV